MLDDVKAYPSLCLKNGWPVKKKKEQGEDFHFAFGEAVRRDQS